MFRRGRRLSNDLALSLVTHFRYSPKKPIEITGFETGEDALFGFVRPPFFFHGVADGVGGYARRGVNPAELSNALMSHCGSLLSSDSILLEQLSPTKVLCDAFAATVDSHKVKAGGTTVVVSAFDGRSGILRVSNIGDSGFIVFRDPYFASKGRQWIEDGTVPWEGSSFRTARRRAGLYIQKTWEPLRARLRKKKRTSDSRRRQGHQPHATGWRRVLRRMSAVCQTRTGGLCSRVLDRAFYLDWTPENTRRTHYRIIAGSLPQQHRFNCPYQLSLRDFEARGRTQPQDADEFEEQLLRGDILLLATDGLLDNLYGVEMEDVLREHLVVRFGGGDSDEIGVASAMVGAAADAFLQQTLEHAKDPLFDSPFARESQGTRSPWSGGKVDDVAFSLSIVCPSVVISEPEEQGVVTWLCGLPPGYPDGYLSME